MVAPPSHLRPVDPGPADLDEARALVLAAVRGDVEAWAALYRREYPSVFRQIRYLTGEAAQSEELAQETFAQAIASVARYDPARPFGAWLHGIALNVVRKSWRQAQSRATAHARLQLAGPPPAPDDLGARQRGQALYAALAELPERWREAFVLRELRGLDAAEAAEQLGVSTANLHVRVTRARARLREILTARGWIEPGEAP